MGASKKAKRSEIRAELDASTTAREAYARDLEIRRRPRTDGGNPQHPVSLRYLQESITEIPHSAESHNKWILPLRMWREEYGSKAAAPKQLVSHNGEMKKVVIFHSKCPPDLPEVEKYVAASTQRIIQAPERMATQASLEAGEREGELEAAIAECSASASRTVFSMTTHAQPLPNDVATPKQGTTATGGDTAMNQPSRVEDIGGDPSSVGSVVSYPRAAIGGFPEGENRAGSYRHIQMAPPSSFGTRVSADMPRAHHYHEIFVTGDVNPFAAFGAREVRHAMREVQDRLGQAKLGRAKAAAGDDHPNITNPAAESWLNNLATAYKTLAKICTLSEGSGSAKNTSEILRLARETLIPVQVLVR